MCKGPEAGNRSSVEPNKGSPRGLEAGEGGEEVIFLNVEK